MTALARVARVFETAAYAVAVLALLIITCAMVAQVIFRYALSLPLQWSETVSVYALVWVVFIGAGALAFQPGGHVSIPSLTDRLPVAIRALITVLGRVGIVAFALVIIWISLQWLTRGAHQMSPVLGLSTRWVKLCLPLGIGLLGVAALFRLAEELPALIRRDWTRFPREFSEEP
ncbi:MAG: TRAP transporter small permease [Pararhodobacter sp.]